jgi:hypothetical protein
MCREYGRIDQNSLHNLLTNMDQYACMYAQMNRHYDTLSIKDASLHMYV